MKIERVLLFVVAAGTAISISNAQTTTAPTATSAPKITTSPSAAAPATPPAKTEAKPAAPAPTSPPELHQLDYFVGSWQCTGKNLATSLGPERPVSARVDASWELGGNWLVLHYNETMTTSNPTPVSGQQHEGWDVDQKKFTEFWIDNTGGFQSQTSAGWDGNNIVWEGPLHAGMGEAVDGRDTLTKKSANEMTHTGELNLKGTWTTTDQEDCKRVKPATKSKKTR